MIKKIELSTAMNAGMIELVRENMPVATIEKKGLAAQKQAPINYYIKANESIEIELNDYGIYLFVSRSIYGVSLLIHKGYFIKDFIVISDPTGIIGKLFSIEQLSDGGNTIRICNLKTDSNYFLINRL